MLQGLSSWWLQLLLFFSETNLLAVENMQKFWLNSEKNPHTLCCNFDWQSINGVWAPLICKLPQTGTHPLLHELLQVTHGEDYTLLHNRHLRMLSRSFSLRLPPFDFFFLSYGKKLWNYMLKSNHEITKTVILIKSWWQIYVQRYMTFFHFASQGWHEKMFTLTHSVSSLAPRENVYLGQCNKSKLVLLLGEGRSLHKELKAECLHSQPWPGW